MNEKEALEIIRDFESPESLKKNIEVVKGLRISPFPDFNFEIIVDRNEIPPEVMDAYSYLGLWDIWSFSVSDEKIRNYFEALIPEILDFEKDWTFWDEFYEFVYEEPKSIKEVKEFIKDVKEERR